MTGSRLHWQAIRAFCLRREVELTMIPAHHPRSVSLRGEYEGYGDFFTIEARDVEYIDFANGIVVADLVQTDTLDEVAERISK